VCIIDHTSY